MKNDTIIEEKKGLMLRPTSTVRAFLDKKKKETGVSIAAWITMLIVKEMEREKNE